MTSKKPQDFPIGPRDRHAVVEPKNMIDCDAVLVGETLQHFDAFGVTVACPD